MCHHSHPTKDQTPDLLLWSPPKTMLLLGFFFKEENNTACLSTMPKILCQYKTSKTVHDSFVCRGVDWDARKP